jgi:DNA primase
MESKNLRNVEVLEYYGAVNPPEGPGWKNMICPFHEESRPSARSNGSGFICMGCGVQGDALKLIMEREGIGYFDSLSEYERLSGQDISTLRGKTTQQRRRPNCGELSETPRNYERNSSLFSAGARKRPSI